MSNARRERAGLSALAVEWLERGGGPPERYPPELARAARPAAAKAVLEMAGGSGVLADDERYALAVLAVADGAATGDDVLQLLPALLVRILATSTRAG